MNKVCVFGCWQWRERKELSLSFSLSSSSSLSGDCPGSVDSVSSSSLIQFHLGWLVIVLVQFDSVPSYFSNQSGDYPDQVWFSASRLWIPLGNVEFGKNKTFRPQGRVQRGVVYELCNSKKLLLLLLHYQRRKSEDPPICYSGTNRSIRILWLHVSFIYRHSKLDDYISSSIYKF